MAAPLHALHFPMRRSVDICSQKGTLAMLLSGSQSRAPVITLDLRSVLVCSGEGWAASTDGWRRHELTLDDLDATYRQRRRNRDLDRVIGD